MHMDSTLRPIIGITTSSYVQDGKLYNRSYHKNAEAIAKAGGLPIFIPTSLDVETLRAIYDRVDAVLLPGGPDVDPMHYGEERHPRTIHIDHPRDELELTIARWQVEEDRPTFGICRGHQLLNVALGGTLVQDIPDEVGENITHDQPDGQPRSQRLHTIDIAPGSRLASILGMTQVSVNSLHHQSVEQAAPGSVVTAHAPDGVIEAMEMPDKRFMISVQWHPEDLYDGDESMRRLFEAFISAAAEDAARRRQFQPV